MQLNSCIHFFIFFQLTLSVYAFRDYPSNYSYSNPSRNFEGVKNARSTIYEKSLTNILARKKRAFVFFKGAVVILTQVLSKAIVARTPRGVLQSSEIDMFYDVPILIEGWKKPLEKFANQPKGPKKSDKSFDYIENDKYENVGVINASSSAWDDYNKGFKNSQRLKPFILYNQNSWRNKGYPNRKYYLRKPFLKNSNPYNYNSKYNQLQYHHANYMPRKKFYQFSPKNYNQFKNPQKIKPQFLKQVNPMWHEHREYRERRGLFEHIEGFGRKLGISLRSCILRAICEIKTQLLPQGESFINDVARILFTIPTNHENKDDDYVQMALDDNFDCVRRFMVSCPHSPLRYFSDNFKANSPPAMSEDEMMRSVMYA